MSAQNFERYVLRGEVEAMPSPDPVYMLVRRPGQTPTSIRKKDFFSLFALPEIQKFYEAPEGSTLGVHMSEQFEAAEAFEPVEASEASEASEAEGVIEGDES